MWWLWLILIGFSLFIIITCVRCLMGNALLKQVQKDSLIVAGRRGKGKTRLFSKMTENDKKTGYISTTDFGHKGQQIVTEKHMNVDPNTWKNVLEHEIIQIKKQEDLEGKPFYLDDAGVYLPNFMDSELKKQYPSMPVAFALWRHLYNAPAHLNAQRFDRVWKLLREQADGYILCRGCVDIGPLGFIRCTYYEREASAVAELRPMKLNLFNKFSKAEVEQFKASNGLIKDFLIFSPHWQLKYDSRHFHEKLFGYKAPKKKPLRLRRDFFRGAEKNRSSVVGLPLTTTNDKEASSPSS